MTTFESRPQVASSASAIADLVAALHERHPHETEFLQAAEEVLGSLAPVLDRHPEFLRWRIPERIVEPERIVAFRVTWTDDRGEIHVNRGWRVQFNGALGLYKGGLRFHRSVNLSVLKFLGFEQIFKNALTTLPLGGGKGGSDFDPKGRSDAEVMRFCQAFMAELWRHIGPETDVPAGDVGVGAREIGFMFGQYRRLANAFNGVFTGKGVDWGGSLVRPEATGYGCVFFAAEMLQAQNRTLEGATCIVSGSGNVAQFTCQQLLKQGATPIAMSDSSGWIHDPAGIDEQKLQWVMDLKNRRRGRLAEYPEHFTSASYHAADPSRDHNPIWSLSADCAFPCATQNELNGRDAEHLLAGGATLVCEGANMPCTPEAVHRFRDARILFGPGKAANAGGVATSGLEMSQNALKMSWSREEVESRLREIMRRVHAQAHAAAEHYGDPGNYVLGANAAGFAKVARAMIDQGVG